MLFEQSSSLHFPSQSISLSVSFVCSLSLWPCHRNEKWKLILKTKNCLNESTHNTNFSSFLSNCGDCTRNNSIDTHWFREHISAHSRQQPLLCYRMRFSSFCFVLSFVTLIYINLLVSFYFVDLSVSGFVFIHSHCSHTIWCDLLL